MSICIHHTAKRDAQKRNSRVTVSSVWNSL